MTSRSRADDRHDRGAVKAAPAAPALDDATRADLRGRLEARAAELGDGLRAVDAERADEPGSDRGTVEDSGDQGERLARQAVRDAEEQRDADELQQVRAALRRLDDGRYGPCLDCGEPIAVERLAAQPAVARCRPCQERVEYQQRLHPGAAAPAAS